MRTFQSPEWEDETDDKSGSQYEQLNISRDIAFDWVVRLEGEGWGNDRKPILASLTNQADKWEILCLARYEVSHLFDKVGANRILRGIGQ